MNLLELTWNEIDTDNSIIIVGLAPIEEHGRHLPICIDYYLTEKWIKDAAKTLNQQDSKRKYYTLPTIPIGNANIKTFIGNLHLEQRTIYNVVKEILLNIHSWGVKNIIIISAHADPKHQIAIEQACDYINKKKEVVSFSPMGALFSGQNARIKFEQEEMVTNHLKKYPNDFHAGWIETSLMLYYDKSMVRSNYKTAENIVINPKDMASRDIINEKLSDIGHLGYPSLASYELGEKLHFDTIKNIVKAIEKFVDRSGYEKYMHHFLYRVPFLRVNFLRR